MKSNLRNNFYGIFNQLFYVLTELLVKRWIAMSRPSFCYNRVRPLESGCDRNCFELITAGKCSSDPLMLVHLSSCAGCPTIHSQAPTGNQSAQWTGQPSSATQASLSQSGGTKPLQLQGQQQPLATSSQVGQCAPEGTTPASQPAFPASSCRSANEQLAAEVSAAVLTIIGSNRPDAQCRFSIRSKIAAIVSHYSVSAEGEP